MGLHTKVELVAACLATAHRHTQHIFIMPGPAASATNVGAGSPRSTSSPRAGGAGGGGYKGEAFLHGRLPRYQGWARARVGDVPAVHLLRVHAPHLEEVQQSVEASRSTFPP